MRGSTVRLILSYRNTLRRLFKIEALNDGSLKIIIDRQPTVKRGALRFDSRENSTERDTSDEEQVKPHGAFTCHVTGQVNRDSYGRRAQVTFIEPLFRLSRRTPIGFYSVPDIEKLDELHGLPSDTGAVLQVPDEISERITFLVEVTPKNSAKPTSLGVVLGYEIYDLVIQIISAEFPVEMAEHFIEGGAVGQFDAMTIDIATAELTFHQTVHGHKHPIFRLGDGSYVALTAVPMRVKPKLGAAFLRDGLSIEQIEFERPDPQPVHKVRFWICDKGGRNRKDDLRPYIKYLMFDSRI
jgi:hypothetical protein